MAVKKKIRSGDKSTLAIVLLGIAITGVCIVISALNPHLLRVLHNSAYDQHMRHSSNSSPSKDIVIVDIDEKSLKELGQWPWPRHMLATLTDNIFGMGGSVIAFDMTFAEPDRTSPKQIVQHMDKSFGVAPSLKGIPTELYDYDRLFAVSLSAGDTILACYMNRADFDADSAAPPQADPAYANVFIGKSEEHSDAEPADLYKNLFNAESVSLSTLDLRMAARNSAFFNSKPAQDNVNRKVPLVWAYGKNRRYPSVALEAVRLHLDLNKVIINYNKGGITELNLGDTSIPTDPTGRMLINYYTEPKEGGSGLIPEYEQYHFPSISALDLISGEVSKEQIEGKIVFVGTSAPGLLDIRATPFDKGCPGVQIHATIASNILKDNFLYSHGRDSAVFDVIAILLCGALLTFTTARGRAGLSFGVAFFIIATAIGVSIYLFQSEHIIYIPTTLIMALMAIYTGVTLIRFWQRERSEAWIRGTFGAMVSRDVLHYLESDARHLGSEGKRVEATMFFSDLAGFSKLSENLDPQMLQELLNMYLSPMSQIIMDREGYVDKYEGDLIMAVWGVPYPIENHAAQACLAALEQRERLKELQADFSLRFGHSIDFRIGINTGRVVAGNMGSDQRFQYTVIGDAVNIAARLEPINKSYGTSIIIGESTYQQSKDHIEARLLDRALIPGTTHTETFYELIARKGGLTAQQEKLRTLYEDAFSFYQEDKKIQAIHNLDEYIKIEPRDLAAIRLRKILRGKQDPLLRLE